MNDMTKAQILAAATLPRQDSIFAHARHIVRENPVTGVAFVLFALIVFAGLFGPYLVPYDPYASSTGSALQPPSREHWFGTDQTGRDIFSRVVVATRLDLGIAVASVALVFAMAASPGWHQAISATGPTASSAASATRSWPFHCSYWPWASWRHWATP